MPSYFLLRTNLCRNGCTWMKEYFLLDSGLVSSVVEYEDKFMYRCPAAPVGLPVGVVPCSDLDYEAALAKCVAIERKKRAEAKALADARKLLRKGMAVHAHAAEEAGAAEPAPVAAPHLLDDFTVLDLEFQGTDILELAAVRYQNWQPVDKVQTFVRFRGVLNYHVSTLTGISSADVYNAPEEKQVLQLFKMLAGDSLLVCHNISADRRVLEAARARLGAADPLPNKWLCTLALSKQRFPNREHALGKLCNDFNIADHGAHRAMRDVEMCAALLQHLHKLEPINELPAPTASKAKAKKASSPTLFSEAA